MLLFLISITYTALRNRIIKKMSMINRSESFVLYYPTSNRSAKTLKFILRDYTKSPYRRPWSHTRRSWRFYKSLQGILKFIIPRTNSQVSAGSYFKSAELPFRMTLSLLWMPRCLCPWKPSSERKI